MINIVHLDIHFDDSRGITAVDVKLKSIAAEGDERLLGKHEVVASVSAGFFSTTILSDVPGTSFKIELGDRNEIVNVTVSFPVNKLTIVDIANFTTAFQKAIDGINFFK